MLPSKFLFLLFVCTVLLHCTATAVRSARNSEYSAKIVYCDEQFNGGSLSNKALLVLPIYCQSSTGPLTCFSSEQQIELLQKVRSDVTFELPDGFNKKYQDLHDTLSLARFFEALNKSDIVAVQTSDSVWKCMDASFLVFVRVRYAASIKSFGENLKKGLHLDVELWNIARQETVWREETIAFDQTKNVTDRTFMKNALSEAFGKIPGYLPSNNENNW